MRRNDGPALLKANSNHVELTIVTLGLPMIRLLSMQDLRRELVMVKSEDSLVQTLMQHLRGQTAPLTD